MRSFRKLITGCSSAALALGSMVAFPGAARAAPGDISMSGTVLFPVQVSLAGTGATAGSMWTGTVDGSGGAYCLQVPTISFSDTITWVDNPGVANDPATQSIMNAQMTINTTTCTTDRGICRLSLYDPQDLTTAAFNDVNVPPVHRTGTFVSDPDPIEGFELNHQTGTTSCTAALEALIRAWLADSSGNTGVGPANPGDATVSLNASLYKDLTV
jgi:hypothetical protein